MALPLPPLPTPQTWRRSRGVSPYTVDLYLVEYHPDGDYITGLVSPPYASRGYAKNEIIAAVGELHVPAESDVYADYYRSVVFTGKNVTLDVLDNTVTILGGYTMFSLKNNVPILNPGDDNWHAISTPGFLSPEMWMYYSALEYDYPYVDHKIWYLGDDGRELMHYIAPISKEVWVLPVAKTAKTYRFLVFGKITGDDAQMSFGLSRREYFSSPESVATTSRLNYRDVTFQDGQAWNLDVSAGGILPVLPALTGNTFARPVAGMLRLNEELLVGRAVDAAAGTNRYYVFHNTDAGLGVDKNKEQPGDILFAIDTDFRSRTEALYMFPNGPAGKGYRVHVEPSRQQLVFMDIRNNSPVEKESDRARLLAFYEQWFEGELGFTAFNQGNLLKAADWHAMAAAAWDITATVDSAPWTPYVAVPENIVTDY